MEITPEIKELLLKKYPLIARNANAIKNIGWTGTTGLVRFFSNLDNKERLQQKHSFVVRYKYPISHGSFDTYKEDYGTLWLDVPYERNIDEN